VGNGAADYVNPMGARRAKSDRKGDRRGARWARSTDPDLRKPASVCGLEKKVKIASIVLLTFPQGSLEWVHEQRRRGAQQREGIMEIQTEFVVMSASTKCPAKFGTYKKVAIVEVRKDWLVDGMPDRIDTRALGVVRIAWERDRLNYGSTSACAFDRALAEAHELAARWNAEGGAA